MARAAKDPRGLKKIFAELKRMLEEHTPPFTPAKPAKTAKPQYGLWSKKDVVIAGRKRSEVYFAGIIEQKGYVGFYYMPVYSLPEAKKMIGGELMATLKGKSCFYIRELTPALRRQIKDALKKGRTLYKKRGWV